MVAETLALPAARRKHAPAASIPTCGACPIAFVMIGSGKTYCPVRRHVVLPSQKCLLDARARGVLVNLLRGHFGC